MILEKFGWLKKEIKNKKFGKTQQYYDKVFTEKCAERRGIFFK